MPRFLSSPLSVTSVWFLDLARKKMDHGWARNVKDGKVGRRHDACRREGDVPLSVSTFQRYGNASFIPAGGLTTLAIPPGIDPFLKRVDNFFLFASKVLLLVRIGRHVEQFHLRIGQATLVGQDQLILSAHDPAIS
jgi:hypothetical protein